MPKTERDVRSGVGAVFGHLAHETAATGLEILGIEIDRHGLQKTAVGIERGGLDAGLQPGAERGEAGLNGGGRGGQEVEIATDTTPRSGAGAGGGTQVEQAVRFAPQGGGEGASRASRSSERVACTVF